MGFELISSRRNPLVKELRELHHPSGRKQQQRLLLEGTHLLEEALKLKLAPDLLLATPQWIEKNAHLLGLVPASLTIREATAEVIAAAATTAHPDGVVAALPWRLPGQTLPPRAPDFGLLLDNVQDPGNLGTLLRTALAAGVDQIWLSEGADPWQPKVLRASSGASLALPIGRFSAGEVLERLRQAQAAGTWVVGTVVRGGEPYWGYDWRQPTLLMLGSEGAGLSPALLAEAQSLLVIPLGQRVESLNVALAAGPLLLERTRQELGAGAFPAARGPGGEENTSISQPPSR
ncbi:MAG: RNA methyltransferase [Cyanobacteriota bacterium]|nr:RNA methyltransferase [Cyanobacteriota bacterium]